MRTMWRMVAQCGAAGSLVVALAACGGGEGKTGAITEPPVVEGAPTPAATVVPAEFGALAGMVKGPGGAPLESTSVWVKAAAGKPGGSSSSVSTDQDGRFQLERLDPGTYQLYTQTIAQGRLLNLEQTVELRGGERTEVLLDFSLFQPIAGKVTLAGGPPPSQGFRIDLVDEQGVPHELVLGPEGKFDTLLTAGSYKVAVTMGYFGLRYLADPIAIEAKGTAEELVLDIPTGEVEVVLKLDGGREAPPGFLTAEYLTHGDSAISRVAMSGGRLSLGRLVPGEYSVGVMLEGGQQGESGTFTVQDDKSTEVPVVMTMPQVRTFHGSFVLPAGRHEYKFFAPADNWQDDILNPSKVGEGMMANAVVTVPGGATGADGSRSVWPRVDDATNTVQFWVSMPTLSDSVYVRGTFNNWRVDNNFRLSRVQERTYELTTTLPPGTYEYKMYSTDDIWWIDTANPNTKGDALEINNVLTVPAPGNAAVGEWPAVEPASGKVTFRTRLGSQTGEVYVRGAFNEWKQLPEFRMRPVD